MIVPKVPHYEPRNVIIRNAGSGTIPSWACVECTGTTIEDHNLIVTGKQPSRYNVDVGLLYFNMGCPIIGGAEGEGTQDFPAWATFTGATAAVGSFWGPKADSWDLHPLNPTPEEGEDPVLAYYVCQGDDITRMRIQRSDQTGEGADPPCVHAGPLLIPR